MSFWFRLALYGEEICKPIVSSLLPDWLYDEATVYRGLLIRFAEPASATFDNPKVAVNPLLGLAGHQP
jgi:hypothetical protein